MARIQRHFPPTMSRCTFSPERLLTPPPTTIRNIFSLADMSNSGASSPPRHPQSLVKPVKKPVGEVGKAYDLLQATSLDTCIFQEIKVCFIHPV